MKKIVQKIKVKNALGLHARPAAMIAKLLQGSKSQVSISYRQETVNARSIMSILMLAIKKNSQIILTVEGEDAEETVEKLTAAFENQFGEMQLQFRNANRACLCSGCHGSCRNITSALSHTRGDAVILSLNLQR